MMDISTPCIHAQLKLPRGKEMGVHAGLKFRPAPKEDPQDLTTMGQVRSSPPKPSKLGVKLPFCSSKGGCLAHPAQELVLMTRHRKTHPGRPHPSQILLPEPKSLSVNPKSCFLNSKPLTPNPNLL